MNIELELKPHIAEWLNAQYAQNGIISFKHKSFLFSALVSELVPHAQYSPVKPNCIIALPFWINKHRSSNLYISPAGVKNFQRKAEWMFWADVEWFIINARRHNSSINDAAYSFIEQNNITSLSTDAIVKFFYRIRKC